MYAYFDRSGKTQKDGRAFDERTLQAVNLTAANVNSYREFAAAIANAKSGAIITVTEKVLVPRTISIKKSNITIVCEGRGGFEPDNKDLILFSLDDVENVTFDSIKVIKSPAYDYFETFIYHKFAVDITSDPTDINNINVRNCIVEAKKFLEVDVGGPIPSNVSPLTGEFNSWYLFGDNRSFIVDNVHSYKVDAAAGPEPTYFILANFLSFWTIRGNESTGIIFTHNGTLNQIHDNTLMGYQIEDGLVYPFTAIAAKPFSIYFNATNLTNPGGSNVVMGNYCYGYCGKRFGAFYDPTAAPGVGNSPLRDLFFGNFVLEDS
jgi:hypothetical protein